jgi:phosphoesterase RecJ-like protein
MNSKFKDLIDSYDTITVLTHINPDADTIGTALGVFNFLKDYGKKRVEVVSFTNKLPYYLDFLPNFSKIKHKISYDNSLIISCDTGSIDRLGFNLDNRVIINIDHHKTNTNYGLLNIVDSSLGSASLVAYNILPNDEISKDTATCFYTALISDTRYFTTNRVDKDVFKVSLELLNFGVDHSAVISNLTSRKSLASIRLQAKALDKLELHNNGTIASIQIDNDTILETGANISDTVDIVDIALSIVTVEIAIIIIEQDNDIKVSLRSGGRDLSSIAKSFGGGGHPLACGFNLVDNNIKEVLARTLQKIMEI